MLLVCLCRVFFYCLIQSSLSGGAFYICHWVNTVQFYIYQNYLIFDFIKKPSINYDPEAVPSLLYASSTVGFGAFVIVIAAAAAAALVVLATLASLPLEQAPLAPPGPPPPPSSLSRFVPFPVRLVPAFLPVRHERALFPPHTGFWHWPVRVLCVFARAQAHRSPVSSPLRVRFFGSFVVIGPSLRARFRSCVHLNRNQITIKTSASGHRIGDR